MKDGEEVKTVVRMDTRVTEANRSPSIWISKNLNWTAK
jgi:hypothetical protein